MTVKFSDDKNVIITMTPDKYKAINNGEDNVTFIVSAVMVGSNEPVVGANVIFSSDKHALFSETNSSFYGTLTDGSGKATATLTNKHVEFVTVTAILNSNNQNSVCCEVEFVEEIKPLSIESVRNANHTLLYNEPSIIWNGAEFAIQTSGGSGSLQWQEVGSNGDITITSDNLGKGIITVVRDFHGSKTIRIDDQRTGEFIEYSFSITEFIFSDNQLYALDAIISSPGNRILPLSSYQKLCQEWGDMSVYHGWGGEYWTSSYSTEHNLAKLINLDTGIDMNALIANRYAKFSHLVK